MRVLLFATVNHIRSFRFLVVTARTLAGIPAALVIHGNAGPPVNPPTGHVSLSLNDLVYWLRDRWSQLSPVGHARREGRFAPPRSVPRQTCRGKHNAKHLQEECFFCSKLLFSSKVPDTDKLCKKKRRTCLRFY
jgi:hypothetical protein